jgi:hypothetical protein
MPAALAVLHKQVRKWAGKKKEERPVSGDVRPMKDGRVNE